MVWFFLFLSKIDGRFFFYGSVVVADYACMAMPTVFYFFFIFFLGELGWNVAFSFVLCVTHGSMHSVRLFFILPE